MYIANPKTSITPTALDCNGAAAVTVGFEAASALHHHPAEIVLLLDRSAGITPESMAAVKTAAKQFIRDISIATTTPDPIFIGSPNVLWIADFADTVVTTLDTTTDVADLEAAVDAIQISSAPADYRAAFEKAQSLFFPQNDRRRIVVLFSHSAETAAADVDAVVEQMKTSGTEVFCIGLLADPTRLDLWANDAPRDHVSWTNSPTELDRAFREIAAEVVLAGVLDGELTEIAGPDFEITGYDAPTDGTVQLTGGRTLTWTIPEGAIPQAPVKPSLTFRVRHVGTTGGTKEVIAPAVYHDRFGNTLDFPGAQAEVTCPETGADIYPEPCPEPTEILVPGCKDAVRTELNPAHLLSLGRIVQMDVTLKAVCPGKRVAVSIMLMELAPDGTELPRGVKHILVPAQEGEACQDLTLRCVQFSLPEGLDATGGTDSICNSRNFRARVIANYVDTDFTCCDTKAEIL